jgi:hypothetical protein
MLEITQNPLLLSVAAAVGLIVALQLLLTISMLISLRFSSRERVLINKEMYGLVRKLEGLTASRREQMLKHYDMMLEGLSTRLPPTIAAQTSQMIFDAESKILARLAELEPNLKDDEIARKKMDELIKTMESLERTIVVLAADAVKNVMVESRRSLLDEDKFSDISLAA